MTVFGIRFPALYGTFHIKCIRNLAAHISGRKHSGKISNKEWILVESQAQEEEEQEAEVPADSDYLSLSRYLSFLVFT